MWRSALLDLGEGPAWVGHGPSVEKITRSRPFLPPSSSALRLPYVAPFHTILDPPLALGLEWKQMGAWLLPFMFADEREGV